MPPAAAIIATAVISTAATLRGQTLQGRAQRASLRQQESAQADVERRAGSEQRRAELESRALRRRRVDPFSLLGRERELSRRGAAGTLLSGAGGVARGGLTLGQGSLLGAGGAAG